MAGCASSQFARRPADACAAANRKASVRAPRVARNASSVPGAAAGPLDVIQGGGDNGLTYALEHVPELKAWAVDRRVNNARNEGADLIEAVA